MSLIVLPHGCSAMLTSLAATCTICNMKAVEAFEMDSPLGRYREHAGILHSLIVTYNTSNCRQHQHVLKPNIPLAVKAIGLKITLTINNTQLARRKLSAVYFTKHDGSRQQDCTHCSNIIHSVWYHSHN